jgi:hypothetical protein
MCAQRTELTLSEPHTPHGKDVAKRVGKRTGCLHVDDPCLIMRVEGGLQVVGGVDADVGRYCDRLAIDGDVQ